MRTRSSSGSSMSSGLSTLLPPAKASPTARFPGQSTPMRWRLHYDGARLVVWPWPRPTDRAAPTGAGDGVDRRGAEVDGGRCGTRPPTVWWRRAGGAREVEMGLFEEYPWLLVPIIILVVEGWAALKAVAREAL